jgi:predicted nucleotidyltransferase
VVRARFRIPTGWLQEVCEKYHILRLSLFGSVLREDFGPASDVDILLEFQAGRHPGWEIVDLEEELSAGFGGRRVDLVFPKFLHAAVRDRILAQAEVQYEAPDGA